MVIISLYIALVSLCAEIILALYIKKGDVQQLLLSNFIGLFTGSVVAILLNIGEYLTAKKDCLEEYYLCSIDEINKYLKIDLLTFPMPLDKIKNYYRAEFLNSLNEIISVEQKRSAMEELIYFYRKYNFKYRNHTDEDLARVIKTDMDNYKENINRIANQYIEIANSDFKDMENVYGRLDFFFNHKRKYIYNKIHKPLRDMQNRIKDNKVHIGNMNKNISVKIDYILYLQKEIYKLIIGKYIIPFRKFNYQLDIELENLRAYMYHKQPENIEYNDYFLF